ncbi:electron transport complex subunit RsxD [Glaciecola sp. KUL10]|uniref:electron transport complex subunit RsxD n=1 Tax=Glaciecola sp. (strain KUL10) TaxID=2161813 RepID=UPI000D785983|nr:electron transport complex subunit RsxD [Glaciecola sp. KUL10]GBL03462.1 RnfABCDGE type electron transport complex subunit D [Glaciecola sp. KUL10]
MKLTLKSSPHHHNRRDTGQVMRLVIYACIPGIIAQTWYFGFGTLIQVFLAIVTAVVTETIILELRKKNTERVIKDYSAVLAALLLAISIPSFAPWWVIVIGTFFSIAIVKQLYGGLGYNMFNPAMGGYVMLLISFPMQMTSWLPPLSLAEQTHGFIDAVYMVFTGYTSTGFNIEQLRIGVDGVTMATPLDSVKTDLSQGFTLTEAYTNSIFSGIYGQGWAVVSLAYLLGGLMLIKTKVISWHIPGSMILAAVLFSGLFYLVQPDIYASPLFHLMNGSLIIGAFFIATDPVSGATTVKGRVIFGAAIGLWIIIIRVWGGYPDAVAFAVLIMNMAVPLIDYYTQPRTYGHKSS